MMVEGTAGPGSEVRTGGGSAITSTLKPARPVAAKTSAIVRGQISNRSPYRSIVTGPVSK